MEEIAKRGTYRQIDVRLHNDAKYRGLSDRGKLLYLTLLTHPNLTSIGAMKLTESGMAEEMGWDLKAFREAFREGLGEGLFWYCPKAKFFAFPKFLKYNKPTSPNVVVSWSKIEYLLPECELRDKYIEVVKGFLEGYGKAFRQAFREESWKPSPNQEQEQEQEQEKRFIRNESPSASVARQSELIFSCEFFDVDKNHWQALEERYPLLARGDPPNTLRDEISKAADWLSDNSKRFKRNGQGKLKNPRLFLRNWLDKSLIPGARGRQEEKPEWLRKLDA